MKILKKIRKIMNDIEKLCNIFEKEAINDISENNKNKHYLLMLFEIDEEQETICKWINLRNIYFNNAHEALNAYANIPCPASQLISAETINELNDKKHEMIENFQNNSWLAENLYPYL